MKGKGVIARFAKLHPRMRRDFDRHAMKALQTIYGRLGRLVTERVVSIVLTAGRGASA